MLFLSEIVTYSRAYWNLSIDFCIYSTYVQRDFRLQ